MVHSAGKLSIIKWKDGYPWVFLFAKLRNTNSSKMVIEGAYKNVFESK